MIDGIEMYQKILVSGPQRSGTTFVGKSLAHELGREYIDEERIGYASFSKLFAVLLGDRKVVVQCPALTSILHLIDTPSTAVVFMRRPVGDILASQARVGWRNERWELRNYFRDDGVIAEVKYDAWDRHQKPHMRVPVFEVEYESLRGSRFWIEDRAGFGPKQTTHAPKLF